MCTGIPVFVEADPDDMDQASKLIYARTMEFGAPVNSKIMFFPAGVQYTSMLQEGDGTHAITGLTYNAKFAYVGPNVMESSVPIEGFNEKGIFAAGYYFPGFAKFAPFPKLREAQAESVSPLDLTNLILATCGSMVEVRACLAKYTIVESFFQDLGAVPPVHWIIQDSVGTAITLEYEDGKMNIYDNGVNLITNSPSFGWHMTNLSNYVNLSAVNVPEATEGSLAKTLGVSTFGQGSGMLGLPGDYTPPSRFVRAVALSSAARALGVCKTHGDGVNMAWNLINNVSIVKGTAREHESKDDVDGHHDYTQWTSVSDLHELKYYIRSYDNQNVRVVDLKNLMVAKKAVTIDFDTPAHYEDITFPAK